LIDVPSAAMLKTEDWTSATVNLWENTLEIIWSRWSRERNPISKWHESQQIHSINYQ
jgi:hypothetical protein